MSTDNSTPKTISIPLTKGLVTIVDVADEDLAGLRWHAKTGPSKFNGTSYAVRKVYEKGQSHNKKTTPIHRVILSRIIGRELEGHELVDHINGNGLDNRRSNLRLANRQTNTLNTGKRSHNTSGYKGVDFNQNKWRARIRLNNKEITIGRFDTPEQAHAAYCAKAKELHGEFWNPG